MGWLALPLTNMRLLGYLTGNDYSDSTGSLLFACVVFFLAGSVAYFVGYTIGNSSIGRLAITTKTSVDSYNEELNAKQDVSIEAGRNASLAIAQATNAIPENQNMINTSYDLIKIGSDVK